MTMSNVREMRQYTVLQINKFRVLAGLGLHYDREYAKENVDKSRSFLNRELTKHGAMSVEETWKHIKHKYCKKPIRQNSVLAVGMILSGSKETMTEINNDPQKLNQWIDANWAFVCKEFDPTRIIRFTVHRDESTLHIHALVAPITADGRLSASEWLDGKVKLRALHDRYASAMKPFGLERGIDKRFTNAVHQSPDEFYRNQNELMVLTKKLLEKVDTHNPWERKRQLEEVERQTFDMLKQIDQLRIRTERLQAELKAEVFGRNEARKQNLERVKRDVDLIKHATMAMGYKIVENQSTKLQVVLKKGEDTIVVPTKPSTKTGYWLYQSLDNPADRGTIVEFMLKRGSSLEQIHGLSTSYFGEDLEKKFKRLTKTIRDPDMQFLLAREALDQISDIAGNTNYLQELGLSPETINSFEGFRCDEQKALFALYRNLDKDFIGKLCSTVAYTFDPKAKRDKKLMQANLPRGLAFLVPKSGKISEIIITDSPIAALSHAQFERNQIVALEKALTSATGKELINIQISLDHLKSPKAYACLAGNLSKDLKKELVVLIKHAKKAKIGVSLMFENTKSGKKTIDFLEKQLKGKKVGWTTIDNFLSTSNNLLHRSAQILLQAAKIAKKGSGGGSEVEDEEEEMRRRQKKRKQQNQLSF